MLVERLRSGEEVILRKSETSMGAGPFEEPRGTFSDDELTELALEADPNALLEPDAVAWHGSFGLQSGLLPEWYMPTPRSSRQGPWPRAVVIALIAGFLLINAFGLCITSGFISWA